MTPPASPTPTPSIDPAAPPPQVIVSGSRRSGTTLMQQVLCSAPTATPQIGEARILVKLLELHDWGVETFDRVGQWYFDGSDDFDGFIQQSVDRVLDNVRRRFPDAATLVLKAPAFYGCLDAADRFLPGSRYVFCLRNPFDQALSEHEVEGRQAASGRRRGRGETRDFRKLAKAYVRHYDPILAFVEAHPAQCCVCRYEDLVQAPHEQVDCLAAATGLDLSGYDPKAAWKDFLFQDEFRKQPAYVEQYGQPIDESRVGRYTEELTADDIAAVTEVSEHILARHYPELLDAAGR